MHKYAIAICFLTFLAIPCNAEKLICTTNIIQSFSYDELTHSRHVSNLTIQRKYIIEPNVENGDFLISREGEVEALIVCPPITNNVVGNTRCSNERGAFKYSSIYRRFTYWHAFTELEDGKKDASSPSIEFGKCSTYQEQQQNQT